MAVTLRLLGRLRHLHVGAVDLRVRAEVVERPRDDGERRVTEVLAADIVVVAEVAALERGQHADDEPDEHDDADKTSHAEVVPNRRCNDERPRRRTPTTTATTSLLHRPGARLRRPDLGIARPPCNVL